MGNVLQRYLLMFPLAVHLLSQNRNLMSKKRFEVVAIDIYRDVNRLLYWKSIPCLPTIRAKLTHLYIRFDLITDGYKYFAV